MNNISIEFSINDILKLVRQLPNNMKEMLIQEWTNEQNTPSKDIYPTFQNFPGFNEPINLQEYTIKKADLDNIRNLWKDELSAEELCQILTK